MLSVYRFNIAWISHQTGQYLYWPNTTECSYSSCSWLSLLWSVFCNQTQHSWAMTTHLMAKWYQVQVIINAINAIVRAVLSATVLLLIYIWIEFQDLSCHAIGSSLWSCFKRASSCWYHSQRTFVVLRRSWFLNAVNLTLVHFIIEEKCIFIFLLTLIGPWSFR